jgi:hypothetical protein
MITLTYYILCSNNNIRNAEKCIDTLLKNPSFGHKKSPVGAGTPSGLNQHKG